MPRRRSPVRPHLLPDLLLGLTSETARGARYEWSQGLGLLALGASRGLAADGPLAPSFSSVRRSPSAPRNAWPSSTQQGPGGRASLPSRRRPSTRPGQSSRPRPSSLDRRRRRRAHRPRPRPRARCRQAEEAEASLVSSGESHPERRRAAPLTLAALLLAGRSRLLAGRQPRLSRERRRSSRD
jgi:hypothetical protein